jgi:hypothetical protein
MDKPQKHWHKDAGQAGKFKNRCGKSRGQGKPPRIAINLRLENGNVITGTCVIFDNPEKPKSRLFFPAGQGKPGGGSKALCIPYQIDVRLPGGEFAIAEYVNDFLRDIHEQASSEFPEWLEKWGYRSNETDPLLSLDEIREEWKYKKEQFGIFRLAARAGFFTDSRPSDAFRPEVIDIKIGGHS